MSPNVLGKEVGPIGFGLMSLSIQQIPEEAVIAAIKTAVEAGCTFLDGGEFYGTPEHNSLTILRSYFEKYPEDANKVVVNIKGALGPGHIPNGSKEKVSASIENCLRLLGPVGRIDQFEPGRRDPNHDFENETLATIDSYVKSGKIGGISLSEVNADTIRSATKKFKITAVEIELSLFTTDPLTNGVLEACGELSIPVLAYTPLGRGVLTGRVKSVDDLPDNQFLRAHPRLQHESLNNNLKLVAKVEDIAKRKGCTPGQIAINWILALSRRPGMPVIIPIPGSTNPSRIRENATVVDLTGDDLKEIDSILASFVTAGGRYPEPFMKYLNL